MPSAGPPKYGRFQELILSCVAAVQGTDANVAWTAIRALGASGQDVVPTLLAALNDEDPTIRIVSASALGTIGPSAKDVVNALAALVPDEDRGVRRAAALALGEIGPEAKGAVSTLVAALGDERPYVRRTASWVLAAIGKSAKDAVSALVKVLEEENLCWVRAAAAWALVAIEPEVKDVLNALTGVFRDEGPEVDKAGHTGQRLIGARAVNVFGAALSNHDPHVRRAAAAALGEIGPEAKNAVNALGVALYDENADVRIAAAWTLVEIGPEAKDAVNALVDALKLRNPHVCRPAARALGRIKSDAKDVVSALVDALRDPNPDIRTPAGWALKAIGPKGVTALVDALKDEEPEVRKTVHVILDAIGPDAAPALSAVITRGEDDVIRKEAAQVLMRIDPDSAIAILKGEASETAASDEWDSEARDLMRQLKVFYLVGRLYKEGITSFRGAQTAIESKASGLLDRFYKDDIPTKAMSFTNNIKKSPLRSFFGNALGKPNVSLFIELSAPGGSKRHRPPTGVGERFSDDGWAAWEWTDAFLKRHLRPDWFGFDRLTPENNLALESKDH
jgi:HEAT repeat protein